MAEVQEEKGVLSIAGESKRLKAPTKLVLFNQTNFIRVFSLEGSENRIKDYIESIVI